MYGGGIVVKRENPSPSQVAQMKAKELLINAIRCVRWSYYEDGILKVTDCRDRTHPVTEDYIETTYKTRNWGSMYTSQWSMELGINTKWWYNHTREERLVLIVHELTHIKHPHHKPEFWDSMIQNLKDIAESNEFQLLDWDKVADMAERDPNSNCVDRRCETVSERKRKMRKVKDFR